MAQGEPSLPPLLANAPTLVLYIKLALDNGAQGWLLWWMRKYNWMNLVVTHNVCK